MARQGLTIKALFPRHVTPLFTNSIRVFNRAIEDQAGLSASDAVSVSKTIETAVLVSTNTLSGDYGSTFDIDFNITMDNIGSISIRIKEYIDLLPPGSLRCPPGPTVTSQRFRITYTMRTKWTANG